MFETERIYVQSNNRTGLTEWFFSAREGIYGPFKTKAEASKALDEFKKFSIENGVTGGRDSDNGLKLSLVPLDSCMYQGRRQRNSG